jgi:hypothetical protein
VKPAGLIGIILIAIGIIAFAWGGITYKTRERVLETPIGDITAKKEHTIPFSPVLGGICLVGGILLVIVGGRQT